MKNDALQYKDTADTRAFTGKAVFFGVLGAFLINSLGNFSDYQLNRGGTPMVGNHLPIAAFFYLWMVVLFWNGLVGGLWRKAVLNGNELFVTFGITLVSCFAPTSGLMRYLPYLVMMPWYYLAGQGKPQWEEFHLMELPPRNFFPDPVPILTESGGVQVESIDDRVYTGFFTGLSEGGRFLSFGEVPWEAWLQPIMSWGLLILLCVLCICSLSLLVHRQWSWHEQLTYPIAQVAGGFFNKKPGARLPELFKNRLFWFGFVPVFCVYLITYGHGWYENTIPPLSEVFPNLKFWHSGITTIFPILKKAPHANMLNAAGAPPESPGRRLRVRGEDFSGCLHRLRGGPGAQRHGVVERAVVRNAGDDPVPGAQPYRLRNRYSLRPGLLVTRDCADIDFRPGHVRGGAVDAGPLSRHRRRRPFPLQSNAGLTMAFRPGSAPRSRQTLPSAHYSPPRCKGFRRVLHISPFLFLHSEVLGIFAHYTESKLSFTPLYP